MLFDLLIIGLLGASLAACVTSSAAGKSGGGVAVVREERIRNFAATNFEHLKTDIAKGQGEHLATFAALLGVPEEQQPEFFTFTQENFILLFPSPQVSPEEMVAALTRELAHVPQIHNVVALN